MPATGRLLGAVLLSFFLYAPADAADSSFRNQPFATSNGEMVTIGQMKGSVVVLEFWSSACVACLKAIPVLNDLQRRYGQKIRVVGINTDIADTAALRGESAAIGIEYAVWKSNRAVARELGVAALPMFVVIGRDGAVVRKIVGVRKSFAADIEREIAAVLR